MEATVSAQHVSREEIVEAEQPKRGHRGRKTTTKELEVAAPTAAAAASETGAEAIMVEAEMEPGPQIPALDRSRILRWSSFAGAR